jgi:hypothetical protein
MTPGTKNPGQMQGDNQDGDEEHNDGSNQDASTVAWFAVLRLGLVRAHLAPLGCCGVG